MKLRIWLKFHILKRAIHLWLHGDQGQKLSWRMAYGFATIDVGTALLDRAIARLESEVQK